MGPGLTIEGATLPMTLLPNHCEQCIVVSAQSFAALTQTWAVELQIVAAQEHTEHIHALVEIADGQRKSQAKHVGGRWLRFDLSLQDSIQKTDGQKGLGEPRPQHLNIHSVGQIAKASLKCLIHGMDPVQKCIRVPGEKVVVTFNPLIQRSTGLKGLLSLLHRITGQLEQ